MNVTSATRKQTSRCLVAALKRNSRRQFDFFYGDGGSKASSEASFGE